MQSESCSAWSSCEKGTAKGKGKDLLLQGREAEGEQRQGQTQQGNLLTDAAYFAWRIAQSKPDRERKADRVVEAKHEVRRRKNKERSSTTSSKHDSEAKHIQHDAEAKHYVVSAWRRDAIVGCIAIRAGSGSHLCVFFFFRTPPRTFVSTSRPATA